MASFPRIDSPCPYKANLAAVMDGDFCRMCKRNVVDLTAMTDGERRSFLSSCEGEVCVSYSVRPAIAAAALAAAALALPTAAAAQSVEPVAVSDSTPTDVSWADESMMDDSITVGGIRNPKDAKLVENPADASLPAIPVVYEDEPTPAKG